MPHKVKLDPTSIKNPMLRLDCAGTLPPRASCSAGRRGPWCTRERGRHVAPAGESARLRPARRCVVAAPWQDCGEELANASSRWPKCASARASQAGAEQARRDTIPGGGGALAAVHSGKDQAAAGQHDGLLWASLFIVPNTVLWFTHTMRVRVSFLSFHHTGHGTLDFFSSGGLPVIVLARASPHLCRACML